MGAAILIPLVFTAAAIACQLDRRPRIMGFASLPGARGVPLELEEARGRVKFPIPALPAVTYHEFDDSDSPRFELLSLVSDGKQALLSYTHGIWLRITSPQRIEYTTAIEWRSVKKGTVRGEPAQIVERGWKGRLFFCGNKFADIPTIQMGEAKYWYEGASLWWNENGVGIWMTGPYKDEELARIAELLSFS